MTPHTLVLKPGLVIYSIYKGYWFWGRPSVNLLCRMEKLLNRDNWRTPVKPALYRAFLTRYLLI
jgi:hypothetical protein